MDNKTNKPDVKPAETAAPAKNELAEAVKLAVAVGISEGLKAVNAANAPPTPVVVDRSQCDECKQSKAACKGEHVRLSMFCERYPEHHKWFHGYTLNGITYRSSFPGQLITLPAAAESDARRAVRHHEDSERKRETGGEHQGEWRPSFARKQVIHDPNYR